LSLPVAARGRRIAFADGRVEADAGVRTSALVRGALVSNSFSLRQSSAPGAGSVTFVNGSFDLATVRGSKIQLRAGVDYGIAPRPELVAVRVDLDRAFGPDTTVRLSAGHVLAGHSTTLGLSAIRRFDRFSLAFDGVVSVPGRNYSAVLRLGFSFGRNPLDRSLFMARPGLASSGAAAFRVFADEDGDGLFGPNEQPLEGVDVVGGSYSATTDARGLVFIGGLADGARANVRIDGTTLPDVAQAPARDGVEIVPRTGRIHAGAFPVVGLSDVEGAAVLDGNGREFSGLVLELVDADGKVAGRTRTGSGGAFWLEQVRPGTYQLRLGAAQARNLGIELAEPVPVTVGPKPDTLRVAVRVRKTG